jgi:NADH-quinone oxidoreductase subunit N
MPTSIAQLNINFEPVLPALLLVSFALLLMIVDMFNGREDSPLRTVIPWLALVGVAVTALVCGWLWNQPTTSFQGMAVLDRFALSLDFIVLIAAALGILLSINYIPLVNKQIGEYYTLLLLTSAGMMMMGAASDLIVLFLALEIFSLALYILCGLQRENPRSTEASMKYFLLGAFASSFFVYGAALIYGAAGSTQYSQIASVLASGNGDPYLLLPGIALLLVGFGFKASIVPFHMWTPDVYQGAPTPITAFMSAGTKAAAFAALIRVLLEALPGQQETWGWALAILAVLTMTIGNYGALRQTSLKRMLAYSTVAHAGYILVGLAPGQAAGANAAVFYLFTYAFMNIGAFAVVIALEKAGEDAGPAWPSQWPSSCLVSLGSRHWPASSASSSSSRRLSKAAGPGLPQSVCSTAPWVPTTTSASRLPCTSSRSPPKPPSSVVHGPPCKSVWVLPLSSA